MTPRDRLVLKGTQTLPYSKGLLTQSLMGCGISPDVGYRVARIVEAELRRGGQTMLRTDELMERTCEVLLREAGGEAVERYRRWNDLRHLERPLIILIGGAPGTGKSTIATEIAHRLGITRIVSTDVVRQVMRGIFPREILPQIHTSSFSAAKVIPQDGEGVDRTIVGFAQQAETVRFGARGVVARAVQERFPLVLEGVHLVPGALPVDPDAPATVIDVILTVSDEETHQSHFHLRSYHTGDARPSGRYLKAFGEIRQIQDYLTICAERSGVAVVECSDIESAVRDVMDMVFARLVGRRESAVPASA